VEESAIEKGERTIAMAQGPEDGSHAIGCGGHNPGEGFLRILEHVPYFGQFPQNAELYFRTARCMHSIRKNASCQFGLKIVKAAYEQIIMCRYGQGRRQKPFYGLKRSPVSGFYGQKDGDCSRFCQHSLHEALFQIFVSGRDEKIIMRKPGTQAGAGDIGISKRRVFKRHADP
jgi:hypothetical protein